MFLQTGKVLRPARVTFGGFGPSETTETEASADLRSPERPKENTKATGVGNDVGDTQENVSGSAVLPSSWTREEDRVLLQTCQRLGRDQGLPRVVQALGRPLDQVNSRLKELMRLFEASRSDDEIDT